MYNQKMVASIKANGCILREHNEKVLIPFASEYSILIKNLNTVRAVVNVYIDGENHTPNGLVVNAGQEIDLERSLKTGSLTEGNRFKFIERTGTVEQHRGIKLEDGIVRIEYQYELAPEVIYDVWHKNNILRGGFVYDSHSVSSPIYGIHPSSTSLNSINASATSAVVNDAGITVPGSHSSQKFTTTTMGALNPEKHSIVLKLLGATADNQPVVEPVTVKHKPKCVTCGKQNRATAKFCTECGTALEIFA